MNPVKNYAGKAVILVLVIIIISIAGYTDTISKKEAEQAANKFITPEIETLTNIWTKGKIKMEYPLYILESNKVNGGYCIEFAFKYRQKIGWPARELHLGRPSTIPIFVNNKGIVEENNPICLYKAYPELK